MSALTVFSVLRDGVRNGYPFVEAYASWAAYADRILVVDGRSTDGTDRVLHGLSAVVPQLEVVSRPWPDDAEGGKAIAALTNEALALARAGEGRLMYVQADEIFTDEQRRLLHEYDGSAALAFTAIHFWNSLDRVLADETGPLYVRLLPAGVEARSVADGFTFELDGAPVVTRPDRFLHYGWCFPVNILQKHDSHARLYRDSPAYVSRGRLARLMLRSGDRDPARLDDLAPHYRAEAFTGTHPVCTRHLRGLDVYDPYVGLDLLRAGATW